MQSANLLVLPIYAALYSGPKTKQKCITRNLSSAHRYFQLKTQSIQKTVKETGHEPTDWFLYTSSPYQKKSPNRFWPVQSHSLPVLYACRKYPLDSHQSQNEIWSLYAWNTNQTKMVQLNTLHVSCTLSHPLF